MEKIANYHLQIFRPYYIMKIVNNLQIFIYLGGKSCER